MKQSIILLALMALASADVYMHGMRGSNNRLNEQSANRANANRLFDSQNNNRGGYNVGDQTDKQSSNEDSQYRMKYFQSGPEYKILEAGLGSTKLTIEWTNQHGCGGNEDTDPHKQNCNLVLQYMCQENVASATGDKTSDTFRNGRETATPEYTKPPQNENEQQLNSRRSSNLNVNRGQHEPWIWYHSCYVRERNQGLFTADQNLNNNQGLGYSSAIFTRQNPNENRRGYECPEERDYYPYWHPTPWKDMAILAGNSSLCKTLQDESFNVKPKHECIELWQSGNRKYSRYNNEQDCTANNGQWTELYNYLEKDASKTNQDTCEAASQDGIVYKWAIPFDTQDGQTRECLVLLDEPECYEAPWSRVNHLGNGRDGEANRYIWTIPYFPSESTQRCVMRLRYNISTDDYDPYRTDASFNQDDENGVQSPVQQNPLVEIGYNVPLRLAINTAQFGRTFQDRSHVFLLVPRPAGTEDARIYNLNVRGKRGNIVQTYPAVEYDFIPNRLEMTEDDLVHIQWTGSNTHNNGKPAGDGQAGDDGQGTGGTDRSNIAEIQSLDESYPVPFENSTMWQGTRVVWIYHGKTDIEPDDLAISLASSSYYQCVRQADCLGESAEKKGLLNVLLNNAPASYPGVLLKFKKGTYHYLCTRNNSFTNRSQKGSIIVKEEQ